MSPVLRTSNETGKGCAGTIVTASAAALCACLLPQLSWAASAEPLHAFAVPQGLGPAAPAGITGLGQVTFALLVVLTAVFVVAWLVRRVRGFGNRVGSAIDVLAEIPLGQKERAVLVKVGQTQLLLGVAPGRVNTLHVLVEPLDLTRPAVAVTDGRPSFRALMLRSLGK